MLNTVYELETALYRGQLRKKATAESVKQAKYDLRLAEQAQLEYGGSFRSFLDKLSGKQADRAELLSLEVRKADAALKALLRQQEAEAAQLSALREQRSAFPEWDALRTPEKDQQWAALESRLCAEALLPLLEETDAALKEYRTLLRGEFPVLSLERQQAIATAPIARAGQCQPLLQRLQTAMEILGTPAEDSTFFRSPAAFLAAAAKHTQLDRAVAAQAQTAALRKLAKVLMGAE